MPEMTVLISPILCVELAHRQPPANRHEPSQSDRQDSPLLAVCYKIKVYVSAYSIALCS